MTQAPATPGEALRHPGAYVRWVEALERDALERRVPTDLRIGRSYDVDVRIREGDKLRLQTYRGKLIKLHRAGKKSTMTLRKLSRGVGVERVFPFACPDVQAVREVPMQKSTRSRRSNAPRGGT